jgi:hypothetical protein
MRTKTLLLTAALSAAGVATSMAQVYSVNMVGYINQSIPEGFSLVANHLNNSPDNRVITLFGTTPPEGTTVFKFNPDTDLFTLVRFAEGEWGGNIAMTLNPGEGAFINAPSAFTHTFVGEVALSSSVTVKPQFNIVSSALPQSLPLTAGLGFAPVEGDEVFRYNATTDLYTLTRFAEGEWQPGEPTPNIGEAFWIRSAGTTDRSWNRTFSVSGQ